MFRSKIVLVSFALALQGCIFSPGQNLDSSHSSHIRIVPITPKLIAIDAATRAPSSVPPDLLSQRPSEYRVGPNDLLHITVWDHPELTVPSGQQQMELNARVVRSDGTIFFPYIGTVEAAGHTLEEIRHEVEKRLTQYVTNPQIDVAVVRFASQKVVLSGAFNNSGAQAITATPLSLMEAVSTAGVEVANADLSRLVLKRGQHEYTLNLDELNEGARTDLFSIYLHDGDQIHLPYNDRRKIYLMGEINSPRALTYKTRHLTLADALGSVGGLNQATSNGKAVFVIRGVENLQETAATVFQLDAQSPTAFILAQGFNLEPQDVVYVGAAGVTRWNRFISQLLPSAAILGTSASIRNDLNDGNN